MLENTYRQNRLGLVSDAVFDGYGWNRALHQTAFFKDWWEARAGLWSTPDFREFFESRVQVDPAP